MDYRDIAKQSQIENQMLKHLIEAIRSTIAWQVKGSDISRKLSTLRFITHSFQRHLQRLMALEEYDGYMSVVVEASPRLAKTVEVLRSEHDDFRDRLDRIVQELDRLFPNDDSRLERICNDLLGLLDSLEAHTQQEVEVLQENLDRDTGGEG